MIIAVLRHVRAAPQSRPETRGAVARTRKLLVVCCALIAVVLSGCQPSAAAERAARAAMARGQAALSAQRWQEAIDAFGEAIALRPALADAYLGQGAAAAAKGDLDLAERDYSRVIQLRPRSPNDVPQLTAQAEAEAYERRGLIAFRRGDFAAALRDLSYAVKLGGTHAYYSRAQVLRALGERERARLDLMGGGPCNMCMLEH